MSISASTQFQLARITKVSNRERIAQKALFCGKYFDGRTSNAQSVELDIDDPSMLDALIPLVGQDFEVTFTHIEKAE